VHHILLINISLLLFTH